MFEFTYYWSHLQIEQNQLEIIESEFYEKGNLGII